MRYNGITNTGNTNSGVEATKKLLGKQNAANFRLVNCPQLLAQLGR